jgi:phosphoglycerol transferase MdoB-like AlkP superfamily enzyme
MKRNFGKTLFILKLLGICLLFLVTHRVLFLISFYSGFSGVPFIEFIKAFLIGALTDAVASCYFLLPTWLILLFFNIEHRVTRIAALSWFVIGFAMVCVLNLADIGYFPITKKRMGSELLDILPEVPALLTAYMKDYWYLFILLIGFVWFAFHIFKKQLARYQNGRTELTFKIANVVLTVFIMGSIMRGSYGERPFIPFDIPSMVNPKLQWLASNTPFQFIHTLENKNVKTETYFEEQEAENIIGFKKQFVSKEFKKKNILFIILESFCSERLGIYNPAMKPYTPFMDSLLLHARSYTYGTANGRMTIDALPSVLSGMPSFMEKNYCYSNYNNNTINGISPLLEKEGYSNAFFYGGLKTTFGFENFMNINFSKNYYDQENYESHYSNSGWGVDDHLYLPFVARKLATLKQPFCASLLTLSLHHPFPVPEPYKTLLDTIKDPIRKSIKYTDLSMQAFFNQIKNEPWYRNSVIAICADHSSGGVDQVQNNAINEFAIPISFLAVGDTAFNKPVDRCISQIDMFPTVLDYLGYNKPFVCLGNSGIYKQHPTVQYGGNGMYQLFDYPYGIFYDNSQQKVVRFFQYNADRTMMDLRLGEENAQKINELARQVKAYIQVFSYRINKNQF